MAGGQTRYWRHPRIASRTIDGQSFIVVVDTQALHTLNAVGTFIWERLDGATLDELRDALVGAFQVTTADAEADANEFVQTLLDLGAVTTETS